MKITIEWNKTGFSIMRGECGCIIIDFFFVSVYIMSERCRCGMCDKYNCICGADE